MMCYSPAPDRNRDGEDIRPTCYEIVIPDDNDIPDTESSPAVSDPKPKSQSVVENEDAALEEVQQYYEKVKRESPINNADSNDEPTEWVLSYSVYFGISSIFL